VKIVRLSIGSSVTAQDGPLSGGLHPNFPPVISRVRRLLRVPQFFVQSESENPGSWAGVPCGLLSKFPGWNVAQSSERTTLVTMLAPSFDLVLGVVTSDPNLPCMTH
jgi:hypothetical protein